MPGLCVAETNEQKYDEVSQRRYASWLAKRTPKPGPPAANERDNVARRNMTPGILQLTARCPFRAS